MPIHHQTCHEGGRLSGKYGLREPSTLCRSWSRHRGGTHAVAQRWREWIALVPEGRAEEESDDGIRMAADNVYRDGDVPTVGGVGEVPVPPREMQVIEDGVGRERDKLRTVMEEMVVG